MFLALVSEFQEMEGSVKKLLHSHLWLLAIAATIVLIIDLYRFIRFVLEH